MKKFILFFVFVSTFLSGQAKKLFFKVEKDTIISIVDENGNILIKPFSSYYSYTNNEEITDGIIYISERNEPPHYVNREGKFLFTPYFYDNGPDYPNEYSIRFTDKEGKVGIADLSGKILIPAKYDYLSAFNFGFTYYCQGCYFDREKDPEHPPLVNIKNYGYLDRNGKEIKLNHKRIHRKDTQEENGKFVPYQFSYTDFEKNILKKLEKNTAKINKINLSEGLPLTFEIIRRPDSDNPYYFIKMYRFQKDADFSTDNDNAEGFNFYADKKGNLFVNHLENIKDHYQNILIPFEEWLKLSDY
ncbi:hypothetical protein J3D55_001678 [Chryseobacterium ginsenosidimutans]|uniref:WG repeat-containing protein n=1 Tax=Chryseobacterium ginsenosidimutans TaxID=687846 RepID=UPI00216A0843|nr:WG repeat-containing protein [Chryseobacterium ginsenosidimutans]MCS3868762.1 hypothetical protein [Chryseobacterium ginsenosidimutans]